MLSDMLIDRALVCLGCGLKSFELYGECGPTTEQLLLLLQGRAD